MSPCSEGELAAEWDGETVPPRLTPSPMSSSSHLHEPVEETKRDERAIIMDECEPPPNRSIYRVGDSDRWRVTVKPYDPRWPEQFQDIRRHLEEIFTDAQPPAVFEKIEHIGSTAVPGLAAKPNIDVLVTLPSQQQLDNAIEALIWEIPNRHPPFVGYTRVFNGGGIQGRESFKQYVSAHSPHYWKHVERSVYLINADATANPRGKVQIRCYRSVCSTLRDPANSDLLDEYGRFKLELAQKTFENSLVYSARKDDMVRKILLRGGWTATEVDEKESLSKRNLLTGREDDDEEDPY